MLLTSHGRTYNTMRLRLAPAECRGGCLPHLEVEVQAREAAQLQLQYMVYHVPQVLRPVSSTVYCHDTATPPPGRLTCGSAGA